MTDLEPLEEPDDDSGPRRYDKKYQWTSVGLGNFQVVVGFLVMALQIAVCASDSRYWQYWGGDGGRDIGYIVTYFLVAALVSVFL